MKTKNINYEDILTKDEFQVCRKGATEMPFSGKYNDFFEDGIFLCKCCKAKLFSSKTKFNAGCGWPSFYEPISKKAISEYEDNSHFMRRIEVRCSKCNSHLGHVFDDGPKPTKLRYCINSLSLDFVSE